MVSARYEVLTVVLGCDAMSLGKWSKTFWRISF